MCNSSLGVWKTFCLLIFVFVIICLFLFVFFFVLKEKKFEKKNKKLCYVFVKFELNYDCDMHFNGLLKGLTISLCQ
jgi:hypothetical protein